jgi:hypothetical protein
VCWRTATSQWLLSHQRCCTVYPSSEVAHLGICSTWPNSESERMTNKKCTNQYHHIYSTKLALKKKKKKKLRVNVTVIPLENAPTDPHSIQPSAYHHPIHTPYHVADSSDGCNPYATL